MKFLAVVILLVGATLGATIDDVEQAFEDFKEQYSKGYETEEEENLRYAIFEDNCKKINKHNDEAAQGFHTYTLGINEYADMRLDEFVAFYNGLNINKIYNEKKVDISGVPESVDWRPKGYVTPVKNQKQCGSCWAFSAVGSMEGANFKSTGKLVSLSEQNLVDCDKKSFGCMGGLMDNAFQYVIDNKGIDTEQAYPYEAVNGKCRFEEANVGATIKNFTDIDQSESALQKASATIGPISVAIDASHDSFQLYKDGIYYEPGCSSTMLDHGVLVVGYGSDSATDSDYWIVKNSWGTSWGMKGYINMSRNKKNNCGIATQASYPTASNV